MIIEIFASTDVGKNYSHNEDNFAVCYDLTLKEWMFKSNENTRVNEKGAVLLVADGMGGTNAGEVASNLAQSSIRRQFDLLETVPPSDQEKIEWLKQAIVQAHEEIVAYQASNLETAGMGTTLSILWLFPKNSYVAWCGDSRLYIFKENTPLKPFTDDHSFVWGLVQGGNLTPEEARVHPESNIITQSLGTPNIPPKPGAKVFDTEKGDRILLCSDGLNSMLSDQEIANILTQEKGTMNACKKLVEAANRMGGRDNITVLLLDVKEKEAEEEPVTVPEDLKAGINTKNVIFAFVVILLCSIAAYSFYKPNVPGKRTAQVPKQATIVYPLYLGKDTIIDASSLSKEKVDSFVISRAPIYGTISEKSKNSFKYHPIKNNLKKDDSIDIYLYNADIASVAHVIFRFEEEPFDYSTLSNPSDTLFIGAFKDSVYNDSLIQHRLYGFDEDSVSTLQILKENHDSSSLNHKISDSQSTGEKRKPDEPFSTETKKAKGDGSSL